MFVRFGCVNLFAGGGGGGVLHVDEFIRNCLVWVWLCQQGRCLFATVFMQARHLDAKVLDL